MLREIWAEGIRNPDSRTRPLLPCAQGCDILKRYGGISGHFQEIPVTIVKGQARSCRGVRMRQLIGNKKFYQRVLMIAVPIMIQNGITNFVGLLDNIMVGMVGTEQMTGISI